MPGMKGKKKDFDLGDIEGSFGGILKGFTGLIDMVSKAVEKDGIIERSGEIKGLGKDVKGVYGVSVKTLAGKQVVEPFGNIRETSEGPVVEESREPIIDVFDEKDHIRVVAEMPGVEEKDIGASLKGRTLSLKAKSPGREYAKDVTLPAQGDPETMACTYRNGVLEVKVKKARKK